METTTFVCSRCGAVRPLDEQFWVGNEAICEDCALDYTSVCDHCGTRVWDADTVEDENTVLCEECFQRRYTRCHECGCIISNDSAYYDDRDNAYCGHCWDGLESRMLIHEYSYKPKAQFYGEGDRYFGVELEIDGKGCDTYAVGHILDAANACAEHLYIKSDGSLDCGMELVTHPMTLDYHMTQIPWKAELDEARELDYLNHKTTACGLHVHISRRAFGETAFAQECTIARLLYFVEKFWPELLRFSRRTESQMNRWAARYGMRMSPQEVLDNAKGSRAGRYTAVNLHNYNTVEIRIFRGTLKLNTLLATLQMVNAICDVAVSMYDEELQRLSWHNFPDHIHFGNGIHVYKRPLAARRMRFHVPNGVPVVMGHTRMTTQGNAKHNYNNHPWATRDFALAHNGVLWNDKLLRETELLPQTHIETDSYIALQLLEQQKALNFQTIRAIAELVRGSFVFTILDRRNNLYFVRGDNPLAIFDYGGFYLYASTEQILYAVEQRLGLEHRGTILVKEGDILKVSCDGACSWDSFEPHDPWMHSRYWLHSWYWDEVEPEEPPVNEYLRDAARSMGVSPDDIQTLLDYGCGNDEIEALLYNPRLLHDITSEIRCDWDGREVSAWV